MTKIFINVPDFLVSISAETIMMMIRRINPTATDIIISCFFVRQPR